MHAGLILGQRAANWWGASLESALCMCAISSWIDWDSKYLIRNAFWSFMTSQLLITSLFTQIARSCNVTNAVTGAPLSAPRPCLFGKKCDNERREQIVYNGQDWLVSKCRRPRRGGRDSSSEEDSSEEELLTSTTTTITPDLPFQPWAPAQWHGFRTVKLPWAFTGGPLRDPGNI